VTGSRVATIVILLVVFGFPFGVLLAEGLASGAAFETLLDARIHQLLLNSLLLAALTSIFAIVLGAPLAALFAFREFRGRGLLMTLATVPLLVPQHIQAIGWMRVLGRQGLLTLWLEERGIPFDVRAPFLGVLYPGPAWILACAFFPLVTFSLVAGFRTLDRDALEAARLVAGPRVAFFRLALPQVAPAFWAGVFLVFVLSVCAYPVPSLLDTPVLIQRIFFTFSQREQIDGVLLALPLLMMSLVLMLLVRNADALVPSVAQSADRIPARRGSAAWALAGAIPVLLAAGAPLFGLVAKIVEDRVLRPDTPSPFLTVFDRVRPAFWNSMLFTGLGIVALVACAWPIAHRLARARSRFLENLLFASLALPPLVLGVGVVLAWKRVANVPVLQFVYWNGILLVVLAYLGRFLPIIVRVLRNGFGAIDPQSEEAARLLGHGPWRRAFRILLPQQLPAVGVGALLAYVLCLTELDATIVTYPPGYETVQVRIFNMVHYFRDEEVAALCLLVVGLALVPVAVCAALFRRPRIAS
jgi:iron(III) transport system permease protein